MTICLTNSPFLADWTGRQTQNLNATSFFSGYVDRSPGLRPVLPPLLLYFLISIVGIGIMMCYFNLEIVLSQNNIGMKVIYNVMKHHWYGIIILCCHETTLVLWYYRIMLSLRQHWYYGIMMCTFNTKFQYRVSIVTYLHNIFNIDKI